MVINAKNTTSDLKKLIICHLLGIIVVAVFGAFSHTIAQTFPNIIIQILLPTNYSLWEQGKLLVTPILIVFVAEYFIVGKNFKNFIPAHLMIAFAMPMLTYGIYHVYRLMFSTLSLDGAHILLSLSMILAGYLTSILMVTSDKDFKRLTPIFLTLYIIMLAAYVIFTFSPPHMETWFDTLNEVFGPAFN